MKNKYYTPKIEEFHVGFEFEVYEDYDVLPEKSWHKETYPSDTVSQFYLNEGLLRVKSLDQEDIESLGFEQDKENPKVFKNMRNFAMGWAIVFKCYDDIYIYRILPNRSWSADRFRGKAKNKSELKKILKMIGYEANK